MFCKQPRKIRSKATLFSRYFMVFVLLFSAGVSLHGEFSLAGQPIKKNNAKNKPVKRQNVANSNKKNRKLVRRNQSTPAGVFALYQNPLFGYGKCLPSLQEPAHKVLSRNGIDTVSASDKEKAALAIGIAQVERLLGKPIPQDYRYDYQWKNASGPWNSGISRAGYVTVKRPAGSLKGQLTGRMMHELGHRFGHANGNENYNEYRAHMRGKKCMITTYCGKSLNEEFAEVFEAYIVNPDFLAKHCPDSFNYFKTKLFRNPEALLVSCENPNSILDHDHEDDEDAVEDTDEQQIDEDQEFLPTYGPVPLKDPRRTYEVVNTSQESAETPAEAAKSPEPAAAVPAEDASKDSSAVQPQGQESAAESAKKEAPTPLPDERKLRKFSLPQGAKVPVPAAEAQ